MNKQQIEPRDSAQNKEKRAATSLILLCWLVYSCSYIGKVNYSANINLIQEYFKIDSYSTVGLAGTLFFFAYGIGQIVNGILCKKYNIKWIIFASLCTSISRLKFFNTNCITTTFPISISI